MPEGCLSIEFAELCQATEWAKQQGGWIVKSLDERAHNVRWFPAAPGLRTMTAIIEATGCMGDCEIGPWPMFAG